MAQKLAVCLLLLLYVVDRSVGYSSGAPGTTENCKLMVPGHIPFEPQPNKPPYQLNINKGNYAAGESLNITISSPDGRPFKGFFIQARRVDPNLSNESPVGHFTQIDGTKIVCNGLYGNALTHSNSAPKTSIRLTWSSDTPSEGHIQFRVTIVENHATFWAAEKSEIIIDRNAPPLESTTAAPPLPFSPIDVNECGDKKGCYRNPPGCREAQCDMIVTWEEHQNYVTFEMSAETKGWVALGLSHDKKMGDDDVTECVWNEEQNEVVVRKSFNEEGDKQNTILAEQHLGLLNYDGYLSDGRIRCRFDRQKISGQASIFRLDEDYHLLVAKGKVDMQGRKEVHLMEPGKYPCVSPGKVSLLEKANISGTARYLLVKLHACLMLFAWMMCCTTAILLAKYYKPMWPNDRICKDKVWFAVHRGCQVTNLLCTVVGFILIFIHVWGYSWMPNLPAKAHPILGIITTCLCVLNPLIALCRPSTKSSRRPIFNWIHWFFGTIAMVLATPTIFIGLNLPKAHVPWWATWVMVAFLLWHLITELMLEIHGCMNSKKQKMRNEEFELRKKTDGRGDYYGLEPEPVGTRFKKRILGLYLFVVIVLGLVMIITVAVS